MKKVLTITARVSDVEDGVMVPISNDFFTEVVLNEEAIIGDDETDESTMLVMTLPLLESIRDCLGIENPTVRRTRELEEATAAGKVEDYFKDWKKRPPLPDWLAKEKEEE